MASKIKRVAVIGAGPSGAIAVDALAQEQAFDVIRVFERKEQVGGTWVFTPELEPKIPSLSELVKEPQNADTAVPIPPKLPAQIFKTTKINSHQYRFSDTPMNEHLESNIGADVMSFTQEPFPSIISARSRAQFGPHSPFRHREVIREWIESLFNRNGYRDFIEFSTTVELAEKKGNEWILTLRKEGKGEEEKDFWWQETFDALVVATGHYNVPYIPDISGLVELNEKVPGLVVHSKQYRNPEDFRGKKVVVVGASVSSFDIAHDILSVVKAPLYASLRSPHPVFAYIPFTHPEIDRKPVIAKVSHENRTVWFSDGSKLEEVDHIIFATGYSSSLPFLPTVKVVNRRILGLYQHIFKQDDPTLAFIGGTAGGFTFRVFEWQAVLISRFFAGRTSLPSLDVQRRWEADRLAIAGDGVPFYKLAPRFEEYFEAIRLLAGDPKPGVPGRVLPRWDPKWLSGFNTILETRMRQWKEKAAAAEERLGVAREEQPIRAKL